MLRDVLNHALQTGPGLTSARVVVVHAIAPKRYEDPVRGRRFQNHALERASNVQGVTSAAWTSSLPLVNTSRMGYAKDEQSSFVPYDTVMISSGYFATMNHPILAGREFDDRNDAILADAAIVNLPLAQALFGDRAVGQHLITEGGKRLEIVGVVSDAKYRKMAEPIRPTVFVPMSTMYLSGLYLVARTAGDASIATSVVAEVLRSIDSAEIDRETTLDWHLQTAVRRERVALVFVAACSVIVLVTALVGPYLLTRHAVVSRHDELAVRLAIGARAKHMLDLVFSQAAKATISGIVIGEAGALALAAAFAKLTGTTMASAAQLSIAAAVVLTMSCALAVALPALRILRISPAAALR